MAETDLAYINYGVSDHVWTWIQKQNEEHLLANPTCELCHERPSVRITPIGTVKASCLECIAKMRQDNVDFWKNRHNEEA